MLPSAPPAPRISVLFLLYNAAGNVEDLVARLAAQRHPERDSQTAWLTAIFVDDASTDDTVATLRASLGRRGDPPHYRSLLNSKNLGLAGSLNQALGLVASEYVLTCHCDCLFADGDYVATALALLERHPEAAAISGQARLMPGRRLPFAEMLNHVTNLMDIAPEPATAPLVPLGFAEGRCDAFRTAALRAVGGYSLALRTAGEDQLLAADLRRAGYRLFKAPGLHYYLLASTEQDTLRKLLRHQRLFGRMHPYILFRHAGSLSGLVGEQAGRNRRHRSWLRLTQLLATPLYLFAALAFFLPAAAWVWLALGLLLLARLVLFLPLLRLVDSSFLQLLGILALQPALDFAYTAGVLEGLFRLRRRPADPPLA